VLFFKEYASLETCPICKESRWRVVEKTYDNDSAGGATTVKKRLPVKILRYFPLISSAAKNVYVKAHIRGNAMAQERIGQ